LRGEKKQIFLSKISIHGLHGNSDCFPQREDPDPDPDPGRHQVPVQFTKKVENCAGKSMQYVPYTKARKYRTRHLLKYN
jgi:hypothetical protein